MLRVIRPGIQTVNMSCPGETTTTFIQGGCQFPNALLHTAYAGTQLQAALAFLQAHPGQVNPITLSIGANDVNAIASACGGLNLACVAPKVPAAVAQVSKNLTQILTALRQAAPNSEIILLAPYNPYAAVDPATNPFAEALDKVMSQVADQLGVITVNAYNAFNLATPQPQSICRLTNFCLPASAGGPDIHASDAGYAVIANLTWAAAGYARYGNLAVVGFDSAKPGQGQVYFGTGPKCSGLYAVATQDLHPGTTTHVVLITGNDLAGSTGGGSLLAGVTYSYQTVTWSAAGMETDNNAGSCYSLTTASM
jgi:lysophospholipase L1-like esterase